MMHGYGLWFHCIFIVLALVHNMVHLVASLCSTVGIVLYKTVHLVSLWIVFCNPCLVCILQGLFGLYMIMLPYSGPWFCFLKHMYHMAHHMYVIVPWRLMACWLDNANDIKVGI
ncbi:unnamed protein product [Lathyrus oleraceus]